MTQFHDGLDTRWMKALSYCRQSRKGSMHRPFINYFVAIQATQWHCACGARRFLLSVCRRNSYTPPDFSGLIINSA
jgi:hypothetical protein